MYAPQNASSLEPTTLKEFQYLSAKLKAWIAVDHNEDGTHNLRPSGFDFVPIGAEMDWDSDIIPPRWLVLDGAAKSRTAYRALFEHYGTTHGAGDGVTTFNVPDYRGRFCLYMAAAGTGSVAGSTGGAIDHTHSGGSGTTDSAGGHNHTATTTADGAHTHSQGVHSHAINAGAPLLADGAGDDTIPVFPSTATDLFNDAGTGSSGSHSHTLTTDSVGDHTHTFGAGTTGTANPPYIVCRHRIVLAGV